jgi:hypothetical protein
MKSVLLNLGLILVVACGVEPEVEKGKQSESAPAAHYMVLHKLGSSVGFYTSQGRHVKTTAVGKNPHEMILSADGRYAYVTDYGELKAWTRSGKSYWTVFVVPMVSISTERPDTSR